METPKPYFPLLFCLKKKKPKLFFFFFFRWVEIQTFQRKRAFETPFRGIVCFYQQQERSL